MKILRTVTTNQYLEIELEHNYFLFKTKKLTGK